MHPNSFIHLPEWKPTTVNAKNTAVLFLIKLMPIQTGGNSFYN